MTRQTENNASDPRRALRAVALGLGAIALAAGLFILDVRAQGLAWRAIWSLTGEESLIGQVRGLIEVGGNLWRSPLAVDPYAPINHAADPPFGINVFLQKEVEEAKMRALLDLIREAGFVWLRQEFPWEDIEVDGRGQFTDTRNDYTGDGVPDTIDAWLKYDRLVALTEEYGLRLLVRLSNPPAWSRAENPDTLGGALSPPDDVQDFVNFAVAVAERYRGRIHHYQIWNEPNIYPEWGERFADPAAYTDMLCRTYAALRAVDPDIVVVSAAIAPTISLDGYLGYQDMLYLQAMYEAGAGACFDVLSAQAYGLFSGPTDQRRRLTTVTFARHEWYRALMVAHGDRHKPIWISEMAWNAVLDADLPPEQIADYDRYGVATLDQAARYGAGAYRRAHEEWPWVGQMHYWFFTRADDSERNQSFYYFRMAEPDYSPERGTFTTLPVYDSIRATIADLRANPVLYRGTHQAEHWAITRPDDASLQPAEGAHFDQAVSTGQVAFSAHGTSIQARVRNAPQGLIIITHGTLTEEIPPIGPDWQTIVLHTSAEPQTVYLQISQPGDATGDATTPFEIDAVRVVDARWANRMPYLLAGLVGLGWAGLVLWGLWQKGRS